jgi:hypothetical protein
MRFSWTALIVAPLLVPVIFCVATVGLFGSNSPALQFLIMLIVSCTISYGVTIFLFLPSLFLLSQRWPLTAFRVCLVGLALGVVADVLVDLVLWKGSGPDSGPPVENFLTFLLRFGADPTSLICPFAGLVTSGFYWWLASRSNTANPNPRVGS